MPLACPKDVVTSKQRRGGGLEALDKAGDDCGFASGWEAWEDPEQRSHWFFWGEGQHFATCEDPSSPARDQNCAPEVEAWSLNHWTSMESPLAYVEKLAAVWRTTFSVPRCSTVVV